jgi:hypothetical protein
MAEKGNGKGEPTKPLCFVVGPIGKDGSAERKHADLLLNAVIKHVLTAEEFGYQVKRADEDSDPGMIGDRMISDVINADLVVADLTDLNPNAFYELGIRHSTEKPTIHIARLGTILPFDTITHRTIFVDLTDWYSTEQSRARLAESARAIKLPDYKVSNPITQANASFKMRQSEDPRDRVIANMVDEMETIKAQIANMGGGSKKLSVAGSTFQRYVIRDRDKIIARVLSWTPGAALEVVVKEFGIDPETEKRLTVELEAPAKNRD